ncbi:hypothetical protein ACFLT5_00770 [Chloroflexota bacterium]
MNKRWLLAGLVLLVTLLLLPLFRDFVRHVLLPEMWSTVIVVRVILASLPQLPMWLLFVVLILFLAAVSFLGPPTRRSMEHIPVPGRPGQVAVLSGRIRRVAEGEYYRWDLARHLSTLVLDVMAHDRRTTRADLQQRLRSDQFDVPPEVLDYLRSGQAPIYTLSMLPFAKLRRILTAGAWSEPVDQDLEHVLHYMEGLVEVQHDIGDE